MSQHVSPFKKRFSEAPWFEKMKGSDVLLIGAGGIGSWVALCLARIGCNLVIYDMDTVESHNLGGQLYGHKHVGMLKTEALVDIVTDLSGKDASIAIEGRYTNDSYTNNIVVAAFDNMAGRKLAFTKWKEAVLQSENKEEFLFVDGRLLAEQYQVLAVTHSNMSEYEKTLFDDTEVEEVLCTLKSTTHCSMGIAHDMVAIITNFMTNRASGMDIRDVPFLTEKTIPLMMYGIKNEWNEEGGV